MRRILALLLLAGLLPGPARADCPSVAEVARLASAILDRRPAPPPPGAMSTADALCARDRLVAVLAQPWGDQVGWKIAPGRPALTGALFHGTLRLREGETFGTGAAFRRSRDAILPARFGIVPQVAAGLLLRIRDEGVNEAGDDHLALLRHVEAVLPFLDLTDRVYPPDVPWTPELALALNLGTRLGVVGRAVPAEATPAFARALGAMTVTLSDGTREVAQGPAVAGHPLDALARLVRELREQGRRLRAGEHVAIAGLTPAAAATPGNWTATYAGLAAGPIPVGVRLE